MTPASPRAVLLVAFLLGQLLLEAACVPAARQPRPLLKAGSGGAAGMTSEDEKVRLGSSPPSCHGKCYECSPCAAVQVPTMSAAPSGPEAAANYKPRDLPLVARLSNYKPVGWKCQCRDRLYEP